MIIYYYARLIQDLFVDGEVREVTADVLDKRYRKPGPNLSNHCDFVFNLNIRRESISIQVTGKPAYSDYKI